MALDSESQNLLNLMAAANRPAWVTLSPAAAREQYLSTRAGSQGPVPQGVTVRNRHISGTRGAIAVRLYRPDSAAAEAKLPALVFAHGGGWVFGNLDSHDVLCAQLAIGAGIAVLAIDYRLAPEARFPGAFDDVVAGLKWAAAHRAPPGLAAHKLPAGGGTSRGKPPAPPAPLGGAQRGPHIQKKNFA